VMAWVATAGGSAHLSINDPMIMDSQRFHGQKDSGLAKGDRHSDHRSPEWTSGGGAAGHRNAARAGASVILSGTATAAKLGSACY